MSRISSLPGPAARAAVLVTVLAGLAGCAEPVSDRPTSDRPGSDPPPLAAWAWELPRCAGYQPADYPAVAHRRSASSHRGALVSEREEVYEPGWGPRAMADIRSLLRDCASYEYEGPGEVEAFLEQHRVVGTGFAGDESLLVETVRLVPPQTRTRYAAVVRYGDRVITLRAGELGPAAIRCLVSDGPATCPAGQA